MLVTGGTGFVGRHLVTHLCSEDRRVRVLTRDPERRQRDLPYAEFHRGDLLDEESLNDAVKGVDTVVHLAGRTTNPTDQEVAYLQVNARGTANLARACVAARVRRFIHVSSAGVYGDAVDAAPRREADPIRPGTAYERSKAAGEHALRDALRQSSLRWVILRPAGVYGPERAETATLFTRVAHGRPWIFGPAPVVVHPTHVQDVVHAILLTLEREDVDGEMFNIAGDRPLDLRDLIALIARTLARRPRTITLHMGPVMPPLVGAMRMLGRPVPPSFRPGGVHRALDTSRARDTLGLRPLPLESGLEQTARALRERGAL